MPSRAFSNGSRLPNSRRKKPARHANAGLVRGRLTSVRLRADSLRMNARSLSRPINVLYNSQSGTIAGNDRILCSVAWVSQCLSERAPLLMTRSYGDADQSVGVWPRTQSSCPWTSPAPTSLSSKRPAPSSPAATSSGRRSAKTAWAKSGSPSRPSPYANRSEARDGNVIQSFGHTNAHRRNQGFSVCGGSARRA